MFNTKERNKAIHAMVVMTSGDRLDGHFIIAETSDLSRTMNSDGRFVDFETHDGTRLMLSKASISAIACQDIPKDAPLEVDNDNAFDPWQVLGVERNTPWEAIEARHASLSRAYHPQRFAVAGIPSEISAYAVKKSKMIALAFQILSDARKGVSSELAKSA